MANYLDEDELKSEILKVQMTQKIRQLSERQKELQKYARYKWELQELENLNTQIAELLDKGADASYSLDKFGGMIMLLLQNIATKSNFSGYSWRDEFFGDATEKIIKYLHNFDATKISEITGQPVKAFAYLTQIINMSFIHIINQHNEEMEAMKNNIPLLESNLRMDEVMKNIHSDTSSTPEEIVYSCVIDLKDQLMPPFTYNDKEYNSVYCLLKEIRQEHSSVKCVMNKNNIIPLSEYQNILNLKFDPLNLTRFVHKNKFPPKKKKEKISLEDEWMKISSGLESQTELHPLLAQALGDN